jgi:hypothetical protein
MDLQLSPKRFPDGKLLSIRLVDVGSSLNLPVVSQPIGVIMREEVGQVVKMVGFDGTSLGISRPPQSTDAEQSGREDLQKDAADF